MNTIGERVKRLRDGKNWSQQELAVRAGVSMSYVRNLEQGVRITAPSVNHLRKLAAALGVSSGELTGESPATLPGVWRPAVLGDTAAGLVGIDPKAEVGETLDMADLFPGDVVIVRVVGRSMIDDGILPGDRVVIRRQPEASPGESVLVLVGDDDDGGYSLKKLAAHTDRKTGRTIRCLIPRNEDMAGDMIPLDGSIPCRILGKFMGLIRKENGERTTKPKGKRR